MMNRSGQAVKNSYTKQQCDDLRAVLKTAEGRRLVWGLIENCGVYGEKFNGNSRDFYAMGRRSVGLGMLNRIRSLDPELAHQCEKEHIEWLKQQSQQQKEAFKS